LPAQFPRTSPNEQVRSPARPHRRTKPVPNQRPGLRAKLLGLRGLLGVRASYEERSVEVRGTEHTILLHPELPRLGDPVEAQVVLVEIDFL